MFDRRPVRALLGPADPAADVRIAPPAQSARDLIAQAGTGEDLSSAGPTRRGFLLAAAVTAVAGAGVVTVVARRGGTSPVVIADDDGSVVVPIDYEFPDAAAPAADTLRALADVLAPTPYDDTSGRYAYHEVIRWGATPSVYGDLVMSDAVRAVSWATASDVRLRLTRLAPEFPDEASRRYWQGRADPALVGTTSDQLVAAYGAMELPVDRAGLRAAMRADDPTAVTEQTGQLFERFVVPQPVRAEILRVLADVRALRWRGRVTDRAGRGGVALTLTTDDREDLLVIDERTGDLLATETLSSSEGRRRVSAYRLILESGWTDTQP